MVNISIWKVLPKVEGTMRIDEFLSNNMVAIGWSDLGNLTGKIKDEIIDRLANQYGFEGIKLRNTAAVVDVFLNKMNFGDWVLCPNGDQIYIGEVTGDYSYESTQETEGGFPHQRDVKWLNKEDPIHRVSLPESLRNSLKGWLAVTNLGDYHTELAALLAGELLPTKPVPPAPSAPVIDKPDETVCEMGEFVEEEYEEIEDNELVQCAKSVLMEELESDDPQRRLAAAIEVLNYFKES